jgi:hypothetical protein
MAGKALAMNTNSEWSPPAAKERTKTQIAQIEVAAFLVSHCIDFASELPKAGKPLTLEFALTDMVVEDVAAYIRLFEECGEIFPSRTQIRNNQHSEPSCRADRLKS